MCNNRPYGRAGFCIMRYLVCSGFCNGKRKNKSVDPIARFNAFIFLLFHHAEGFERVAVVACTRSNRRFCIPKILCGELVPVSIQSE